MNPNQIINDAKNKFQAAVTHFQEDVKSVRTGRANAAMLDGVTVTAYGTSMPLNQVGNITTPEPQLLQITPFDPNNIQAIASSIRDNPNLGMNPMDDGRVVRIPVPALTEERRREYVKILGGKVEDSMVRLRNARHDALKSVDQGKKDKEFGEDEAKRLTTQIEEAMNSAKRDIESLAKAKETEIMTV